MLTAVVFFIAVLLPVTATDQASFFGAYVVNNRRHYRCQ